MSHRFLIAASLLLLTQAATTQAEPSRLLGPNNTCLGLDGPIRALAPVRMEPCSDAPDQLWNLEQRGFSGPMRLGNDFCLFAESGVPQVFFCGVEAEFHPWHHTSDGLLIGTGGVCLAADPGGAELVICTLGANAQTFLAETRNTWSPSSLGISARKDYFPTKNPAIWYRSGSGVIERSEDSARTFAPIAFRQEVLAVAPHDASLIFTRSDNVVLRSSDGGRTFVPALGGLFGTIDVLVSRHDPQRRVFARSFERLWASLDGGITFLALSNPGPTNFRNLELAEAADGTLFLLRQEVCTLQTTHGFCTHPQNAALYRSRDGGATFSQVYETQASVRQLLVDPKNAANVFLTALVAPPKLTLIRSTDGGASFGPAPALPDGTTGRLKADPSRDGQFYFESGGELFRSIDTLGTWQPLTLPNDAPIIEVDLEVADDGRLLLLASDHGIIRWRVYVSIDQATFLPVPHRGFGFQGIGERLRILALPAPGRFVTSFLNEDRQQQIVSTRDAGRTWQRIPINEFIPLSADPFDANKLWGHNGLAILLSQDDGATFDQVSPTWDGQMRDLEVMANGPTTTIPATTLLALRDSGILARSLDGGATWSDQATPDFRFLASDQGLVFAVDGLSRLYRSNDLGASFIAIGTAGRVITAGGGVLAYLEPSARAVRISTDGGLTFSSSSVNEDILEFVNELAVDRHGTIYLAGANTLYRSRDRGRTWQTLALDYPKATDVFSTPLVGGIASDFGDPDRLILSTETQVFLGRFGDDLPLPLGDGRFAASLSWRDPQGQTGAGVATHLTADTGLFWLFTPERSEVAVKLLDARHLNGRFWFFLGSLSNVELDLEIRDRATDEVYRYNNPQGQFLSFGDTQAFPRADATPAGAPLMPATVSGLFGGVPTLTLADRFEVSIVWRTPTGSGQALGRQLSAETAAFRFFSDSNVELLVNIIDGRPINGKYWVFSASLSDVEYEITVKDRMSGAVKTYRNPAGAFASTADTSAF